MDQFEKLRVNIGIAALSGLKAQLQGLKQIDPQTPEVLELIRVVESMIEMQESLLRRLQALSIQDQLLIRKPNSSPAPNEKPGGSSGSRH